MKGSYFLITLIVTLIIAISSTSTFATTKASPKVKATYKTPNGTMAEATNNERRGIVSSKPGDQTGREVAVCRYENGWGAYNWKFVIRATNPAVANKAALYVTKVCKNNNIGYNNYWNNQQGINWRDGLYYHTSKVKEDPSKLKRKVDTSCTPMRLAAFNSCGINMSYPIRCKYRCHVTGTFTGMYKCRTVNA